MSFLRDAGPEDIYDDPLFDVFLRDKLKISKLDFLEQTRYNPMVRSAVVKLFVKWLDEIGMAERALALLKSEEREFIKAMLPKRAAKAASKGRRRRRKAKAPPSSEEYFPWPI